MTPSSIRDKKKASHIDVSTWGTNINFTLGHGDQKERHTPEIIDVFTKHSHVNISEVVVCKFHSVFLASNGSVWTCGHGQGGRLGHGHEKTILIPKKIDYLSNETCISIAAGQDHTVILCKNGSIFTCGLNKHHQMGHYPASSQYITPKQIQNKAFKGKAFIGIAVSNHHTVLYTTKEVFTFGLNAGQLGHPKGDKTQITPRQVSVLHSRDISVRLVACNGSATVVLTQNGDMHILYQYAHKRVTTKVKTISKLVVSGGSLDDNYKDLIEFKESAPLVIYGLYEDGKVLQWREMDNTVRECYFSLHKNISVCDIAVGRDLHIITAEGELYFEDKNVSSVKKPTTITQRNLKFLSYSTALKQNEVMKLSLERVKHVHRALKISSDQFSQNFAILQADPSVGSASKVCISSGEIRHHLSLLLENSQEDYDVKIRIKDKCIFGHKVVLAHGGERMKKALDSCETKTSSTVTCFNEEKFEIVQEVVDYLYTGTCASLYEPGKITDEKIRVDDVFSEELLWSLEEIDLNELDHFQTSFQYPRHEFREEQSVATEEKYHKQMNGAVMGDTKQRKELLRVAKKYKINNLVIRLQNVGSSEKICPPRLFWNKYPEYHDVVIETQDGIEFACHKCILAARLEYFSIMLTTTWVESCDDFVHLKMPIDSRVLRVILDFLYTDEAPTIKENHDLEFLGKLLTITDQLWIIRLKEICEARLSSLICLKNVVEMLEFSCLYNATQLKSVCTEFICLNMSYLFETRSLEFLSEETLHELSKAYRDSIPSMAWRVLTPSDIHLTVSLPQPESPTKSRRKWRKKSRASESDITDFNTTQETKDISNENHVIETEMEETAATCDEDTTEINVELVGKVEEVEEGNKVGNSHEQKDGRKEEIGGWWYKKSADVLESTVMSRSGKQKSVSNPLPIIKNNESDSKIKQPWITSPASPQMCDLRTIMEQEINNDGDRKQKEGKSPSGGKSRPSQRERKKMKKLSEEVTNKAEHENSISPKNIRSPVNPWKSCSLVAAQPMSFRDLLKEEESHKTELESRETVTYQKTKAVPVPTQSQAGRDKKVSPGASPRVWESTVGFSSPSSNTLKFDEIQQLQEEERSFQEKNKKKPLSLIQLEDKAIEELLQHYGGHYNPCEYIEVKRETRTAENPSWVT